MKSDPIAFPTPKGLTESIKRTDGPTDLYSLLYVDDTQQNTSSMATPSSWATFDCKYMVYLLSMLCEHLLLIYRISILIVPEINCWNIL
jgi:hypothetical protein